MSRFQKSSPMLRCMPVLFSSFMVILGIAIAGYAQPLVAQEAIYYASAADYPFLLHLETMDFVNQECVLLQRDGHFHLEEEKGRHTKVFEGLLPEDKMRELRQMIDDDQLAQLTQEQIVSPPGDILLDELHVDVFRGDHWQDLFFMDVASRKPFDRSIAPLVRWLAALHKEPHRELTEDEGKNDCQLPKRIVLRSRNPPPPTTAPRP